MTALSITHGLGAAAALALAACSAAPTQFYTLLPPPAPPQATAAPFQIEVEPVDLPAQVATQQMVVRTGAGEMVPVDTRHWIAPLGDEIRGALSAGLMQRLGAQDVFGLSGAAPARGRGLPVWRIDLKVQRFESALGAQARIDALWTLRRSGDTAAVLTCASSVTETLAPGYAALAEGHQRALGVLSERIAAAIMAAQHGQGPACPSG